MSGLGSKLFMEDQELCRPESFWYLLKKNYLGSHSIVPKKPVLGQLSTDTTGSIFKFVGNVDYEWSIIAPNSSQKFSKNTKCLFF